MHYLCHKLQRDILYRGIFSPPRLRVTRHVNSSISGQINLGHIPVPLQTGGVLLTPPALQDWQLPTLIRRSYGAEDVYSKYPFIQPTSADYVCIYAMARGDVGRSVSEIGAFGGGMEGWAVRSLGRDADRWGMQIDSLVQ